MRTAFGRSLPLCGLALLLLVGCTGGIASAPKAPAEFPLFTTNDGYASLAVSINLASMATQTIGEIDDADAVRFILTSKKNLTVAREATANFSKSTATYGVVFSNLRPGNDYVLRADIYKSGASLNDAHAIRGQGIQTVPNLTAGVSQTVTIKINSVGNIAFTASQFGNIVSDMRDLVANDTITVNTNITTAKSPDVKTVELSFIDSASASYGLKSVQVAAANGISWDVPLRSSPESGWFMVEGKDASSSVVARKLCAVTIVPGASIGSPITLQ